eukprot:TRINITY_DN975_c0_g1_i2.p1 TRINITY_DN975_c0_g1~~TRINITY_DN975_c0_g1_i2.p1  ORF type:complete len:1042 (-),score=237.95 TRINITY_DN975_c0_g1_i2:57-3182(-)
MGDREVMVQLFLKGAEPNIKDREGATPLHKACFNGRAWCVKYLLDNGADVDAKDNDQGTALHNAIFNGHLECAQLLVKARAKVDPKDVQGRTPLHSAASFGLRECTQLLLDKSSDPNMLDNERTTPLHLAAFNGSILTATLLLDKGANIRAKNLQGITPLHYAAYKGRLGALVLLLERKASVGPQDDKGVTPLHMAVMAGEVDSAAYLIYKGADINEQNDTGNTPLHVAIKYDQVEQCALLVSKKADYKRIKNNEGYTPVEYAKTVEYSDIKEFFKILQSEKHPFSPENKAKWMSLKKTDQKADLKELTEQLKVYGMTVGSKRGEGDAGGTRRTAAGRDLYGQDVDLNDEAAIIEQVKYEAGRMKAGKTLLNILRHLLLIPTHFDVGSKIWELLEFFTHRVVLLRDEDDSSKDVTKLGLSQFKHFLDSRDKIDPEEKMVILAGIHEALNILFPGCEIVSDGESWHTSDDELSSDLSDEEGGKEKKSKKVKVKMGTNAAGETGVQVDHDLNDYREDAESDEDFELPAIPDLPDIEDDLEGDVGDAAPAWDGTGPPPAPGGGPPPPPGGGPPPPMGGPPPLPGKTVVFNGIKLKRLAWTRIPQARLRGSMWVPAQKNIKGVVLDKKTLEKLFYVKTGKQLTTKKTDEAKTQLVSLQRANNVGILLAKFGGISFEDIKRGILKCDEKLLTIEACRSLVRLAPTKDEIDILKEFKGDRSKLGLTEKFFYTLMDIPRLSQRLESFVYKKEFETRKSEIETEIKDISIAMHELRTAVKLRRTLEVVLVLGNFMNRAYGVYAIAQGYTLDSLVKLGDTKSTEKVKNRSKYTLLHHLVGYLEKVKPDLLSWPDEIPHMRDGHAERMAMAVSLVKGLKDGKVLIEEEVKEAKTEGGDPFGKIMAEFLAEAEEELAALQKSKEDMQERFENLCKFFGEDTQSADPVVQVWRFSKLWKEHIKDNEQVRVAQKIAAKKAVAAAQLKKRVGVRERKAMGKKSSRSLRTVLKQKEKESGQSGTVDEATKRKLKKARAMRKRMALLQKRKAAAKKD